MDEASEEVAGAIDIGGGTRIRFTSWGEHDRVGLIEFHRCSDGCPFREDGGWCGGGVMFDLPGVREAFSDRSFWSVHSLDPLTITPSIACSHPGCTHHGWIRDGRWVEA